MGSLADDTIADLLESSVKSKGGRSGNRARARRVVNYAPEVMVKITGNAKGADHVQSHLDYISRNGNLELEDDRGDVIQGKDEVRALAKDWSQDQGKRRKNTRDTTNIVMSMPAGTDPRDVKDAVRTFAKRQFGQNYQYVMALHTDTDSPHVHLTVKNLGYDGYRLNVRKGDPQKWREAFATELERRGVDAEATPRATRGVIKRGVSQVVHHIREKGQTPQVDQEKVREVLEDLRDQQACQAPTPRPWEDRIKERQTYVRKAWLTAAKEMAQSRAPEDQELAKRIAAFVGSMPPMKTERHELQEEVARQLQRAQARQGRGESEERDNQYER
ncbi:relaxase/mobilization nuclease domain-containing protein [Halomonas saccharevitans]|uniref:Relaxase/mobilization nuclease domain-containing protein n=1 Tax=Halomonas saccharevitans TaxID=416872 RepID=A0ABU3NGN7_9GAMM|nr:relaxase/mobilization nuclease domain-containing protein [Halomonas saccharevitans]MDT8880302.1 relaxase/mobilization nuclease domain-containing protein [Halomonas saccharevitans]